VGTSRCKNGKQTNSEENFNKEPKKKTKLRAPTVKMEGATCCSSGKNRAGWRGIIRKDDDDVDVQRWDPSKHVIQTNV
jgi:hypothetical protein